MSEGPEDSCGIQQPYYPRKASPLQGLGHAAKLTCMMEESLLPHEKARSQLPGPWGRHIGWSQEPGPPGLSPPADCLPPGPLLTQGAESDQQMAGDTCGLLMLPWAHRGPGPQDQGRRRPSTGSPAGSHHG